MARTSAGPSEPDGPGLFTALGGRPGISVIVDGLYDRLERDRELTRHFRSRRPGERERLKQFFETIFGGAAAGIRDVGVQRRHLHRLITASESARWLGHLDAAIQAAGAGHSAQAAVMGLLRGPRRAWSTTARPGTCSSRRWCWRDGATRMPSPLSPGSTRG